MAKYIEEYLVALGFDLNSQQGKEYLKMCNDLEQKQKELEKAGQSATDQAKKQSDAQKSRITDTQKEIDLMGKMRDANNRLHENAKTEPAAKKAPQTSEPEQPPAPEPPPQKEHKQKKAGSVSGEAAKAPEPASAPKGKPPKQSTAQVPKDERKDKNQKDRIDGQKKEINLLGSMEKTIHSLGNAWSQLEQGNVIGAFSQGASGVKAFGGYVDGLTNSFGKTNTKAGMLQKTLTSIFGGKVVSQATEGLSSAGADASAAGDAAAGSGLAAAGAAVGVVAGVAAVTKGIYSMADGLAQANTNVETMARKLWITDSAAMQLNGTLSAMGKTTADLNDIAINPTLNAQFKTLQKASQGYSESNKQIQQNSDQWAKDVQTPWELLQLGMGQKIKEFQSGIQKNLTPLFAAGIGLLGIQTGAFDGIANSKAQNAASNYAPQNYSYSTMNEGAKVTYAPQINVTASSDKGQDIADAVTQATRQSYEEAAMVKNLQSPYR